MRTNNRQWKAIVAATALSCAAASLVACTPKPPTADADAAAFVEALSAMDWERAAALTDAPSTALADVDASLQGLQPDAVTATLTGVDNGENQAVAHFTLTWDLPGERTYSSDNTMALAKVDTKKWEVRWQPSVLNPQLGVGQHLELRRVEAQRASVVTADGALILEPGITHRVLINKNEVANVAGASTRVHDVLTARGVDVPPATEIAAAVADTDGPYSVTVLDDRTGEDIKPDLAGIAGITVNDEAAMVRTDPDFAPEIVAAVEKQVSEKVEGDAGWYVGTVNQDGQLISTLFNQTPQVSPAIRISLDRQIQQAAQEAVDRRGEMKAMMVVIRHTTGEVVAVAQTARADEDGPVALTGLFPPGSTFKMITASAGLAFQGLTPGSSVPCPGTMELGNRVVSNYNAFSRGTTTLDDAFAQSCNTTFANVSYQLAPGQLKETAQRFGVGMEYDIPGLTTVTGSVPVGEDELQRVDEGYGQGEDLVSPFGLALVAATAAHGSTPVPWLIEGFTTTVSNPIDPPSPEVIGSLQAMMRSVVTRGTAAGLPVDGEVHAKTGEAEFGGGSHAWFAGYRDDLAFATLIEAGGGSSASVSVTGVFFNTLDNLRAAG
ncbi:MAG: penicillin-binding transpeptidase domain-containing protein [Corynebacterium sp.]|nr:penicillin-binding transpeptidase domain-containing protein [Corynebacterium sp.]